ncbi:MAG: hypothetical protein HY079_10995 [Elusimicrobia bacterium]|nr:hypothetical protein [Elusimicrobiota bacterium]
MEVRTTLAALALLLASVASANEPAGPAYTQAADMAEGRAPAAAVYDGSPVRDAVASQVSGALATGGLTVPAVAPVPSRALLAPRAVPSPGDAAPKEPFLSSRSLIYGGTGAAAGAVAGWFLGGPIGALIGAVAGFAIGFLISKLLN